MIFRAINKKIWLMVTEGAKFPLSKALGKLKSFLVNTRQIYL